MTDTADVQSDNPDRHSSGGTTADASRPARAADPSGKQNIRDRFGTARQAKRYRDRFFSGKHARTHRREVAALDELMHSLGSQPVLLDMPCGTSRFAPLLAAHCGRLLLADASMHMLRLSQETCVDLRGNAHPVQADAKHLPCRADSVDLVFCHRFLNHLPEPADRTACLQEMARVTRRYVVVSCLQLPGFLRSLRRVIRFWKPPRPESSITAEEVIENARRAGLRLTQTVPIRLAFRSAAFFVLVKEGRTVSRRK